MSSLVTRSKHPQLTEKQRAYVISMIRVPDPRSPYDSMIYQSGPAFHKTLQFGHQLADIKAKVTDEERTAILEVFKHTIKRRQQNLMNFLTKKEQFVIPRRSGKNTTREFDDRFATASFREMQYCLESTESCLRRIIECCDLDKITRGWFQKGIADHLRYMTNCMDCSEGQPLRAEFTKRTEEAYQVLSEAVKDLPASEELKIVSCLNYACFFQEVKFDLNVADKLSRKLIDEVEKNCKTEQGENSQVLLQMCKTNYNRLKANAQTAQEQLQANQQSKTKESSQQSQPPHLRPGQQGQQPTNSSHPQAHPTQSQSQEHSHSNFVTPRHRQGPQGRGTTQTTPYAAQRQTARMAKKT